MGALKIVRNNCVATFLSRPEKMWETADSGAELFLFIDVD
jgi:hypothetical protein